MCDEMMTRLAILLLLAGPARAEDAALAAIAVVQETRAELPVGLEEVSVGAVVWADRVLADPARRPVHEAVFRRAYAVLTLAIMARETVLHVNAAAVARNGPPLVCGYDEETKVSVAALLQDFLADGAAAHPDLPADALRSRLYGVNWDEMLAATMLRRFRC